MLKLFVSCSDYWNAIFPRHTRVFYTQTHTNRHTYTLRYCARHHVAKKKRELSIAMRQRDTKLIPFSYIFHEIQAYFEQKVTNFVLFDVINDKMSTRNGRQINRNWVWHRLAEKTWRIMKKSIRKFFCSNMWKTTFKWYVMG